MKKLITEDRFLKACGDMDEEDMRIVKLYILEGSDINITNSENKTGLYLSIEAGNFRIAEMLLETNNIKFNALCDKNKYLKLLLEKTYNNKLINNKFVDFFIPEQEHINDKDEDGFTSLFYALQYGDSVLVEKLIKLGADVNCSAANGYTCPLFHCVRYCKVDKDKDYIKKIKLLQEAGAKLF
jgi:serine/threonine-protein phosphatase 6 regulatory ankyrin repeat subunit A/serine/threonine-protein phosphatase 6 regulatory ankyrin repeat subunit B